MIDLSKYTMTLKTRAQSRPYACQVTEATGGFGGQRVFAEAAGRTKSEAKKELVKELLSLGWEQQDADALVERFEGIPVVALTLPGE